jgi:hypothetical protein
MTKNARFWLCSRAFPEPMLFCTALCIILLWFTPTLILRVFTVLQNRASHRVQALDHQAGPDNKKLEYARQAVEIEDRQNQTEFERCVCFRHLRYR